MERVLRKFLDCFLPSQGGWALKISLIISQVILLRNLLSPKWSLFNQPKPKVGVPAAAMVGAVPAAPMGVPSPHNPTSQGAVDPTSIMPRKRVSSTVSLLFTTPFSFWLQIFGPGGVERRRKDWRARGAPLYLTAHTPRSAFCSK